MSNTVTNSKNWRQRKQQWLRLARRFHLYFGLLMWPWVLVYGVSGFLFNHPGIGREYSEQTIPKGSLQKSRLTQWPAPEKLARDVVKALEASRGSSDDVPPLTLIKESPARYQGDLYVEVKEDSKIHRLRVVESSRELILRSSPRRKEAKKAPFARSKGVRLEGDLTKRFVEEAKRAAAELDIEPEQGRLLRAPALHFQVDDGKDRWKFVYRMDRGSVEATLADQKREVTFTRFVKRLHLSHTYSLSSTSRWIWALIVDIMAFSMVLWALTGLLMWFQMKALRRSGAVFVFLSLLSAALTFTAMYTVFS